MSEVTNGFGSETSNVQGIRTHLAGSSTAARILVPGPPLNRFSSCYTRFNLNALILSIDISDN